MVRKLDGTAAQAPVNRPPARLRPADAGDAEATPAPARPGERVELSPRASALRGVGRPTTEMDAARIAALREVLQNGALRLDAHAVAEKIIAEAAAEAVIARALRAGAAS